MISYKCYSYKRQTKNGRLAQLVRASALQAGGREFESLIAHHFFAEIAQLVEQLTCGIEFISYPHKVY
jgi:hypothetical protein